MRQANKVTLAIKFINLKVFFVSLAGSAYAVTLRSALKHL